ncbi:Reticulocyte-binding protein [Dirofilaria immitis]
MVDATWMMLPATWIMLTYGAATIQYLAMLSINSSNFIGNLKIPVQRTMVQLTPEEELEKQYRDYKAQFEQWKEKNKNSVGTEAYDAYVKQFEAWERDVDQRREMIRAKAEIDAQEAQAAAQAKAKAAAEAKLRKEQEAEEERKKQQLEAETAAQAVAYAQHQQSYLAHHQSAMQLEQQMHQAAATSSQEAVSVHTAESKSVDEALDPTHVAEMMKHMAQVAQMVMGDQRDNAYQQAAQQATVVAQQIVPPPQLWGSDRITYDTNDPLYKRWGLRAAPPYHKPIYKPPSSDYQVTPCWLYVEQMKEEKLMLAPQVNMPPPPFVPNFVPS